MMKFMSRGFLLLSFSIVLYILAVIPPIGLSIEGTVMVLKLHHIAGFFVHTILASLYLRAKGGGKGSWLVAAGISFALGALIEFTQVFLPYRTGQMMDLIQNLIGIGLGQGFFHFARVRGWVKEAEKRLGEGG